MSERIAHERGGYLSVHDARVTIPSGALEDDQLIEAAIAEISPPTIDGTALVGRGVRLSPDGLQFQKPVEVELCFTAADVEARGLNERTAMVYQVLDDGSLVAMSSKVDSVRHCVLGSIEHFSTYIVAAQAMVPGNTPPTIGGATFLPTAPLADLPIQVRTIITDVNGGARPGAVVSAFLHYRIPGAPAFARLALHPDPVDGAAGLRYQATIPAAAATLAGIEYFLEATDNLGRKRTTAVRTRAITATATALRWNPSSPVDIVAGFARDFTLQANDGSAWRNIAADGYAATVGIGTVTRVGPSSVRLLATTRGAGAVTAAVGALAATTPVTVQTGLLDRIEILDANAVVIDAPVQIFAGEVRAFDVVGHDSFGNVVEVLPALSVQGGIGAVDAAGVFTAAATPSTGSLVAQLGELSDQVTVNVVTAPDVASMVPSDGTAGVPIDTTITVRFSGSMDQDTLTASTSTTCTGSIQVSANAFTGCVAMTTARVALTADGLVATLVPAVALANDTTYRVRVTTAAKSRDGVGLAAERTAVTGFTTAYLLPTIVGDGWDGGSLSWIRELEQDDPAVLRYAVTLQVAYPLSSVDQPGRVKPGRLVVLKNSLSVAGAGMTTRLVALPPATVLEMNVQEGWFVTSVTSSVSVPAASLPVEVSLHGCCRSDTLSEGNAVRIRSLRDWREPPYSLPGLTNVGAPDYRLVAVIPPGVPRSPTVEMPGRMHLRAGALQTLPLSAYVSDSGGTAVFGWAPLQASGLRQGRPVGTAACKWGCSCDTTSELGGACQAALALSPQAAHWAPELAGLYAVQFSIRDVDASGRTLSTIPLDVIIAVR